MIKFEFTPKDFAAFNDYYIKHRTFLGKYMRYSYIVIIVILLINLRDLIFIKEFWRNLGWATVLPILLVTAFIVIIFRRKNVFTKGAVNRFVNKNPHVFGYQEITLMQDKLIVQKEGSKLEHSYDNFIGLAENETYYFIFLSTNSAIVIPKEAIIVGADEEMLKSKIRVYK